MTIELNTLSPKKWSGNYGGNRPTLDSSDNVLNGDYAIDTSVSPNKMWYCDDNTLGSPIWTRIQKEDITIITTSPYTVKQSDTILLSNCASTAITANLPASSNLDGKIYYIKKIDDSANAITVDGNAAETIDGELTQVINGQYDSMTIICDGSNWYIL